MRWDWYQSTVHGTTPEACGLDSALLNAWPLSDWVPAKNLNGYIYGAAVKRGDRVLCHVCWGGQPGINCKSTSDESPVLADALAKLGLPHSPTRVDACHDWDQHGLFDEVSAALIAYATEHRLAINQQGDWVRGEARTLYLGSTSSPVRLVLYEKGYEQGGQSSLDWVRLEVRIRPKKQARALVASWEPSQAFMAGWVADAMGAIGWHSLERYSVGTVWRQSDEVRARFALVKQYGKIISRWAEEVGGFENLGNSIRDHIQQSELSVSDGSKLISDLSIAKTEI